MLCQGKNGMVRSLSKMEAVEVGKGRRADRGREHSGDHRQDHKRGNILKHAANV